MQAVSTITSSTVVLPQEDIDTDQIIPARFLTTTSRAGLGQHAFADWRYDASGEPRDDFALNTPAGRAANILVAGRNFGCGSSREHAPWALLDAGLKAVISSQIADIFRSNSLKNGFVPVVLDEATHAWLLDNPGVELTIDVAERCVVLPDGRRVEFPIDGFARHCLLEGVDQLGFLLQQSGAISGFEEARG